MVVVTNSVVFRRARLRTGPFQQRMTMFLVAGSAERGSLQVPMPLGTGCMYVMATETVKLRFAATRNIPDIVIDVLLAGRKFLQRGHGKIQLKISQ